MANFFNTCDVPAIDTSNLLTVGEETVPLRFAISGSIGPSASGELRLFYFTARKSEPITQLFMLSGGVASGATPTLQRVGIWEVNAAGDGTLLAANTVSDTSLFASTFTGYTKALAATWNKVGGRRYAMGVLIVSGAAIPTFQGLAMSPSGETSTELPILAGKITGQSDLPATFLASSLTASGHQYYAVMRP